MRPLIPLSEIPYYIVSYAIIHQANIVTVLACRHLFVCRNARVKGAVQDLGTKKERLFAKSRILHEFAKRLRVE